MLVLTSFKLNWGSYIIFFAKTASKKIGTLICCLKFLSHEVSLYLYKSTICPCVEYCCHVWVDAPSCYLELLDKLQKRICRTVGPSLATSLEPLHSITPLPPPTFLLGGYNLQSKIMKRRGSGKKMSAWGVLSATDICLGDLTMFLVKKDFIKLNVVLRVRFSNVNLGLL